jgi:hypothetical protein
LKIAPRTLLILLLAAGLAFAGFYLLRRAPIAAQNGPVPELLTLVPADAPYLLFADLAALRASPFLTQLAALAPAGPLDREYAEFVQATGFDYTRDLDRVALATQPGPANTLSVAIAEGRFDRERIIRYAMLSGRVDRQNGGEVYVVPASPGKQVAFTFLSAQRILVTDRPDLMPALAVHLTGGLDRTMRDHISRVAGSALFAVGRVDTLPENFSPGGLRSDQFNNLLRSLRWVSFAARPEDDRLKVALIADCETPESARQLAATLDGLRLLAQAALADPGTRQRFQPQAATTLENLLRVTQLSQDNRRIRLVVELTPAMLSGSASR